MRLVFLGLRAGGQLLFPASPWVGVALFWLPDGESPPGHAALGQGDATEAALHGLQPLVPWLTVLLPVLVALLGYGFSLWMKRRDERMQTWSAMLLESHRTTMHYFLPAASMIGAAVGALNGYLQEALAGRKGGSPSLRRGFYYLVMFQWWQQETFREVGGYHFKDAVGERILPALYAEHVRLGALNRVAARRLLDRVLSNVRKDLTLDEFLCFLDDELFEACLAWKYVKKWARGPNLGKHLAVLGAYQKILLYEVNRINLLWYGSLGPLDLSPQEEDQVLQIAGEFAKSDSAAEVELSRQIRAYVERAKRPQYDSWIKKIRVSVDELIASQD